MWYRFKSAFLKWFGDIQVYKSPAFIMMGHSTYKIKGTHQRQIISLLKRGDVLLRRYDNYISGLMIPGYFTHAAIYVGRNQVIHLLGGGICKEDILTFTRCDDIALLRYRENSVIEDAIQKAYAQLKKSVKYDFDFDTDSPDKFYCTEFVDFCFGYPIRSTKGGYVFPDDLLFSSKFALIWNKPNERRKP